MQAWWAKGRPAEPTPESEYLAHLGTLAAGALHEIRSPLCTMAVVVKDLMQQEHGHPSFTQSLRVMAEQVEACRRVLADLAVHGQASPLLTVSADRMLAAAVQRLEALRPDARIACRWTGAQPAPRIAAAGGLDQALINLLNNALDVSPKAVQMSCEWDARGLKVAVLDRGPGFPRELLETLGERRATTKREGGMGIGLMLVKTAVQRAGGRLRARNRAGGGACVEFVVPLLK